jgi:transposase
MKGPLTLSKKERERLAKFVEVKEGRMSLRRAADLLGLSYRQTLRSYKRYKAEGDAGLAHRRRGRPSTRRTPEATRAAVVARYRERYVGFGPTLAAEELAKEGFVVDHETLRRWLLESGDWHRRRKRRAHRTRRPRRERFGELVQIDGSHHCWFEGQARQDCLFNLVDDATGETLSLMDEEETTELAMRTLWAWIERYGIPQALYADKKSVFVTDREPTLEEQLAGQEPLTAFGKACAKLGIAIIPAHSPQAKGRVERNHGVYQDRLVKLLALNSITSIEEANRFLSGGFVDELNAKFRKPPASPSDAHRPLPPDLDLAQVFCLEDTRTLMNDWCIRHANTYYQILKDNRPLPKPKDKITVRTLLDGSVHLWYREQALRFRALDGPLPKAPKQTPAPPKAPVPKPKPKPDHPWRRAAAAGLSR